MQQAGYPAAQQPTVLVLAGLPGSGKSTLAAWFAQAGWQVINQDTLGDRKQCEAACCAALAQGRSCVIDRVNGTMAQRQHWITIGQRYGGVCLALCLELPAEVCLQRALARSGHATLAAADAPAVIDRFKAEWQSPSVREGFAAAYLARTSQEAEALAQQLLAHLPARGVPRAAVQAAGQLSVTPAGMYSWAPPAQQQQQRRQYTSRADAASSWRRLDDGGAPPPSPPRDQQQWQPWPRQQQQQQQQWQPPLEAGFSSAAHSGSGGANGHSNVVPFPGRHGRQQQVHHPQQGREADPHKPRRHPWSRHGPDEPSGTLLDAQPSSKPILMFDANGVLTSHTSMRRSSGLHIARPGTAHLRRLKEHYQLGIFSSASARTVDTALALLNEAAGPGAPLFDRRLVLNRSHTFLAPLAVSKKEWDTCKPLKPYFARLHRVILVDDDSHKAAPGEERNMLLMPCWATHDPHDTMIEQLVDMLLQLAEALEGDPEADVRDFTADATAQLAALAAEAAAQRGDAAGAEPLAAEEGEEDGGPAEPCELHLIS
ncbi:P-loop containing nucleoside triphosphate hydrolase [Chlorella sorokiniana]|uniref:P-loop containing nucleoside triphosphate hydrolase n=1 Tax=Chlorella sorokiniana TaxID=3076 RepID=A0A2P6TSA1_CHLSO|nr:P-loop containing nucleoside triphosphate hydrolase [Chlorella sorokiniana]|eukprot:PRW56924.1 P-loop containing nucleoside triphosphate hydrolase [Chlorella sorokiniana]